MGRLVRLLAVMMPLALQLVGCSAVPDQSTTMEAEPSASLVGLWKVTGVRNTWAVFDARSFTVERDRDIITGSMSYRRHEILAGVVTWHGDANRDVPLAHYRGLVRDQGRRPLAARDGRDSHCHAHPGEVRARFR